MPQKPSQRDYKNEYQKYHSKPEQKKNRATRNAARAALKKTHGTKALQGKDVHHVQALINGGGNRKGNLAVVAVAKNRGFKRSAKNRPL